MPKESTNPFPKMLADRYRLESPVGEGAHATTWRGWDTKLSRPVAVKILHRNLSSDPVFVQRFRDEARVAASVRQGNVVDIYDFGQEQGVLYIVMQFVDGQNLKSVIQQRAPIDQRETRRIIGNVLDGLQAIHAAGIVHRDIKPQNILLGSDGVARVTDFGVAEVGSSAGVTAEGMTIGTVDYMAPEQAQGASLTPAADLYATGVILYEMLTGTLPFSGSSREIMLQHVNAQVIPPSTRMPHVGISAAADAVIAQSMAKQPGRRFASARAMKQAVGQALGPASNTPATTIARPVSAPTQAVHYVPPVSAEDIGAGLNGALKGLIAVLLLGVLGIALWGAGQMLDPKSLDFNLPGFGGQSTQVAETPTPNATEPETEQIESDEPGVIEPMATEPPEEEPPAVPTAIPTVEPTVIPTEVPTDVPTEIPTEIPAEEQPIEPIEPDQPTEDATEAPAG